MVNATDNTYDTNTKLERIAWLSSRDPHKVYTCLMHLYNEESLTQCFHELDGKKAVGIDGVSKSQRLCIDSFDETCEGCSPEPVALIGHGGI